VLRLTSHCCIQRNCRSPVRLAAGLLVIPQCLGNKKPCPAITLPGRSDPTPMRLRYDSYALYLDDTLEVEPQDGYFGPFQVMRLQRCPIWMDFAVRSGTYPVTTGADVHCFPFSFTVFVPSVRPSTFAMRSVQASANLRFAGRMGIVRTE
jgi:hypothetical protein